MTKEQAKETLSRIFNFCEEIDNSLPDDEKTGYKMLPDILALQRYIDDVVDVVWCKDCKYRSRYISEIVPGLQIWECKHSCGCAQCDNDYGFCGYGERGESE